MHEQDRPQVCDPFHALTQNRFVACGELIDAARAHESFESHDAAPDERLHLVEVAGYQTAPQPEVDLRRALHRLELDVERLDGCRHREVVEGHIDETRVASSRQRGGPMRDVLPVRATRLVEVDMGVDPARKDVKPCSVDLFAVGVEVGTKIRDLAVVDGDVRPLDPARGDKRPGANDQLFASSSMNRFTTSMATATSAALTDSAGL